METQPPNPMETGFTISRMGPWWVTVQPLARRMGWLPLLLLLIQCPRAPGECVPLCPSLVPPCAFREGSVPGPSCCLSQELTFPPDREH